MRRPVGAIALCMAIVMLVWLMLADCRGIEPPWMEEKDWNKSLPPDGTQVSVTGRVYRMEERQSFGINRLWIYLDSITFHQQDASGKEADVSYHLICITDEQESPRMGSVLKVSGQFELFTQATNPGQFDIGKYYKTMGIGGRINDATILASSAEYSELQELLYQLKCKWSQRLYQVFPKKEASVLCAMLLGDKTQLDYDIKDLYQQSGIIHILSVSGLHITIFGMGLYKLLRRCGCPLVLAAVAGAVLLVLYGIMTGMGISAVRAIGMYLIRMVGEVLGRTYDMLTALGIMLMLMLFQNPLYLQHSGFLLSYGSVCGIGLLLPMLAGERKDEENCIREIPDSLFLGKKMLQKLKKALLPGISVSLFTLPIQLHFYCEVPVYSVFVNLLVLPFVGTIMATGLVAMLIPGVGMIGIVDSLLLKGYEWLCNSSLSLPFHRWNPGAPKSWQILSYYIVLAGALLIYHHKKGKGYVLNILCRLILPVLCVGILQLELPGRLTVTFLDVGQGDCIVIQTGKANYLFDCGSTSEQKVGENILIPYLKYRGINSLDGVFVSHADTDHLSGVLEILEQGTESGITIERLILPDIHKDMVETEWGNLLAAALESKQGAVPVLYMGAGAKWQSGNSQFLCMHPQSQSYYSESNAYSLCYLIMHGAFSLLLTGDVEGSGEEALIEALAREKVGNITVLKAAHHGSSYTTSEALLRRLHPAITVISCGKDNPYGHPHQELLERLDAVGSRIYQTPETGAVELRVSRSGTRMDVFKFAN